METHILCHCTHDLCLVAPLFVSFSLTYDMTNMETHMITDCTHDFIAAGHKVPIEWEHLYQCHSVYFGIARFGHLYKKPRM